MPMFTCTVDQVGVISLERDILFLEKVATIFHKVVQKVFCSVFWLLVVCVYHHEKRHEIVADPVYDNLCISLESPVPRPVHELQ